jgi:chromosome segregation ATPase
MRAILILLILASGLKAADLSPAEAKLREALRNTMLQLRAAQGERDALQAEKAQLEQDKHAATVKAEALAKQCVAEREDAAQKFASFEQKTAAQELEIARLNESLSKWKVSRQEAVALAGKKEAERARLAQQAIELQRKVTDQQTRNLGMYKVGREILTRYENFGLGTALTAREPFVGTTRVKLENLVQDFQDQLAAQRIKPDATPGKGPTEKPH